ncbi:MAG: GNAT family N-acetyltransferase/peptidase C39 family protein [Gammaproteobacteria bacterium]|nr:GNAT family N-acetyltransferase/peptidase C39 family protein [Gammaproteobacteria bacterium]
MIRPADLSDIDALVAIENRCFETDRLSRRSFRYMLTKANSSLLVEASEGVIRGYALVLYNAGTSLARLYSIAVDPDHRGRQLGGELLRAAEASALEAGCAYMRLEVRQDNEAAQRLYQVLGYQKFGTWLDYYEDHEEAVRYEKLLAPHLNPDLVIVPYYQQTLDFTCGPAALMMAMKALDADTEMSRRQEIRIWREATTVFMTAGHGGCGPYGLALAAHHRGLDVDIHVVDDEEAMFISSVRSEEKKEVIRLVQEDFLDQIRQLSLPLHHDRLGAADLRAAFESGAIPVVLISSYRIYREKFPHWVVVTGFDERYIYVHDPFVDDEAGKTQTDCVSMPIPQKDFERMARYGKSGQRAVLILRKRKPRRRGRRAG